jgi:predicted dithiol-disulfide oxidoreductase (DUF899 family)
MTAQKIVSRDEWLDARKKLLAKEKSFNRDRDALSAARRELPLVKIEEDYRFQSPTGEKTLGDLFGPHSQLIIYHFMFGPDWDEGCPSCSFWADNYNGVDMHLAARDTKIAAISNAPLEKLEAYKKRLGWSFDWVSAEGSTFSKDFGVSFYDDESRSNGYNYSEGAPLAELPGISVFTKLDDGTVCHSYSTYARGLDMLNGAYHLLDLTPKGRDEDSLDWGMQWVRRNDKYE